jgi:polyhydroxyalkanoate synthesis repressor PhaR
MKLIKRYKNRTFYDTDLSKTITIEDIKHYVDSGQEVKVTDNASGNDITAQTLVSILSTQSNDNNRKDDNIIVQLLIKKGVNVMDVAKKLMLAAIGAVHLSKERMEELMDELVKKGEMTSGEKAEALKKMADKFESSTEKVKKAVEEQVDSAMHKFNILVKIDELAKKVDKLASDVAEIKAKQSAQ